jgi:signal recognition particle subunit SEC65
LRLAGQIVHKTSISKNNQTRSVAAAVESLLCKYKVLSSNSSPTKKEKKKGRGIINQVKIKTRTLLEISKEFYPN